MSSENLLKEIPGECVSPIELGHAGWNVLHSAAAMFPYKPSSVQQEAFRQFLHGWSHAYACSHCAYHMRRYLADKPPVVTDKLALNRYMCEFHNAVNKGLGKREYDCDPMTVLQRWHPTFPDMEDEPTIEEQIAEEQRQRLKEKEQKQRQFMQANQQHPSPNSEGLRHHSAEWWRSNGNETIQTRHENSGVRTFNAGWSAPHAQRREIEMEESSVSLHPTDSVKEKKRWWFMGSSAKRGDKIYHSNDTAVDNTTGKKVADDDADVFNVLKRLKSCMVYCPENKNEASTSSH